MNIPETSKQTPRNIIIKKANDGFGFNVRGQVVAGGQIKAIHGTLYAPLQHVSAVSNESAAEKAGLCIGDKILRVNEVDVEGAPHKQVVDLIKNCNGDLHLLVIASAGDEKNNDTYSTEESSESSNDYTDRRSLAITIPDYTLVEAKDGKFHAFNIHIAGRHLCSRRYREFASLHQQLKQEFPDFPFSSLPKKWPFKLSDQQLDTRRRGLEQYLDKICSVRVISDCDSVQEFLSADVYQDDSISVDVEMKIMLPDRSITILKIKRLSTANQVYEILVKKIDLPEPCAPYFYLFEILDYGFGTYVLNYKAVDQLSRSKNVTINQRSALKTSDEIEYIKYAQTLTDIYNTITFPLCPCSSRKDNGCVIVSLNSARLRLHACSDDGKLEEGHIADFEWEIIERYYIQGQYFIFQYKRSTMDTAKPVKLQTLFTQFMYDCFQCIYREIQSINNINK
ncbi:unnamed protein product [Rotaria socialis]|uniref:Sorting nexin-27 n=1 Tax=Rotaria socialis TaxID=392032 RepID=A0A821ESB6_9BILA|nr:unnamed protein product [Rotaria socialis]